jgi:hypothetical protein
MNTKKPQTNPLLFVAVLSLMYFSIFTANANHYAKPPHQDRVELKELPGLWKQEGYGNLIEVTDTQVLIYEISSQHCLLTESYSFEEISLRIPYVLVNGGRTRIQTDPETNIIDIHSYAYQRIDHYPESCLYGITSQTLSPVDNFNVFWHTFNENYAYFDERGVNWNQQYNDYLWRVEQLGTGNTDQLALFEIFANMVKTIDQDGHASVTYVDPNEPSNQFVASAGSLRELGSRLQSEFQQTYTEETLSQLFNEQTEFTDFEEFVAYLFSNVFLTAIVAEHNEILAEYMQNNRLKSAANGQIRWGKMDGNVGYLQVLSMAEFHQDQQLAFLELEKAMDQVMTDLNKTNAMIIDVRQNGGGADAAALHIAQRFFDRERTVFNKKARSGDTYLNHVEISATPTRRAYVKPIYVLTSPATASAAEILTLAMRELPYVKIVGENSNGIFSDALHKVLPNGWRFSLSNEVYSDSLGASHEYIGIVPDRRALMADKAFRDRRQDAAIEAVLEMLVDVKPAVCEYQIKYKWHDYFLAQIRITNISPNELDKWNVEWQYTDDSNVLFYWNANVENHGNFYSASNTEHSKAILPGSSSTFGLLGTLSGSPDPVTVAGESCNQ